MLIIKSECTCTYTHTHFINNYKYKKTIKSPSKLRKNHFQTNCSRVEGRKCGIHSVADSESCNEFNISLFFDFIYKSIH